METRDGRFRGGFEAPVELLRAGSEKAERREDREPSDRVEKGWSDPHDRIDVAAEV